MLSFFFVDYYLYDRTLAVNQFAGPIPSSFGNLLNLKYLYVYSLGTWLFIDEENSCMQNNQLTGSIPREFGHLVNLETL